MPLLASTGKPRVILGLMTFGPDPDVARVSSLDEYKQILARFQARGYNEVDTARIYNAGAQEAFTRDAGWKDRGLTLATKVKYPNKEGDHGREGVLESVKQSLEGLGSEFIDILYLHAADRATPFRTTLQALDELHKAGKFGRLGLSNFTAYEVAEVCVLCAANGWVRPTIYQGMYNAIMRSIEPELVPACRRYGLEIVVYNPIAGGLFSGKINSSDIASSVIPESGRFSDSGSGVQGKLYRERYFRQGTVDALRIAEKTSEKHGISLIEMALRWVVHHSALNMRGVPKAGKSESGAVNDGILIGVSCLQHLEDNLDHIEKGPLPEAVVQDLDRAWRAAKVSAPNYWHGELEYKYDTVEAVYGSPKKQGL